MMKDEIPFKDHLEKGISDASTSDMSLSCEL